MKLQDRSTLVFLTTAAAIFIGSVQAQANNKAFDQTIMVPGREVRIDSLIKIFSRQAGIEFSFNSTKIMPSRKITVPAKHQTLSQWLNLLSQTIGVRHKLVGNHVILLDNSSKVSGSLPLRPKTQGKKTTAVSYIKEPAANEAIADKAEHVSVELSPDQKLHKDTVSKLSPVPTQPPDTDKAFTLIQKQSNSGDSVNRPIIAPDSVSKIDSPSVEVKPGKPFGRGSKTESVQLVAGYSRHGSGDMNGIVFGVEYTRHFTKKFSLNYNIRATINDSKDEIIINNTAAGTSTDASVRFTTAGVQLGVNAGLNIISSGRSEFILRLGGFLRYQSASNGSDGYSVYYPAATGIPTVLIEYNNKTPQETFAFGGLFQLQYNFILKSKIFLGVIAGFQTDTNGDAIPQITLAIGKIF